MQADWGSTPGAGTKICEAAVRPRKFFSTREITGTGATCERASSLKINPLRSASPGFNTYDA
jgi:hypothetical protein